MPVRHVLIVDDSKSARLMLRKMLQGFGLTVDTVDSAEEGLSYLRSQRPDAIFMDHTMPGLDGIAAVKQIKREPGIKTIPVTMYTSKDDAAYQEEARAAGAIGVLVKPATPDALGIILKQMNALFDATMVDRASAALLPTLSALPSETISLEQIEKIALDRSEMVVYNAIESQVLPLINDVIAKLRRDLEAGQESISAKVAVRECEAQLAKWQPPAPDAASIQGAVVEVVRTRIPPLLQARFEAFQREGLAALERQATEVTTQICEGRLREIFERLSQQLNASMNEAVQEVKNAVHATVVQSAREVTLAAIAEAEDARTNNSLAAEKVFQQLLAEAKNDLQRRIYQAAAWATIIGIGAALIVYGLR